MTGVSEENVNDDTIRNDKIVNVEERLFQYMMMGAQLLDSCCPYCFNPLVKEGETPEVMSPTALSAGTVSFDGYESEYSKDVWTPMRGVPFCVACEASVVTNQEELAYASERIALTGGSQKKGSMIIALDTDLQPPQQRPPIGCLEANDCEEEMKKLESAEESKVQANQVKNENKKPLSPLTLGPLVLQGFKSMAEVPTPTFEAASQPQASPLSEFGIEQDEKVGISSALVSNELQSPPPIASSVFEVNMKTSNSGEMDVRTVKESHSSSIDEKVDTTIIEEQSGLKDVVQQNLDQSKDSTLKGESSVTNSKEAESEQNYLDRRLLATKILGSKMLQGYSLKDMPCEICSMPLMEKKGYVECVVCPAIAKKDKKNRQLKESLKSDLSDVQKITESTPAAGARDSGTEESVNVNKSSGRAEEEEFVQPLIRSEEKAEEVLVKALVYDAVKIDLENHHQLPENIMILENLQPLQPEQEVESGMSMEEILQLEQSLNQEDNKSGRSSSCAPRANTIDSQICDDVENRTLEIIQNLPEQNAQNKCLQNTDETVESNLLVDSRNIIEEECCDELSSYAKKASIRNNTPTWEDIEHIEHLASRAPSRNTPSWEEIQHKTHDVLQKGLHEEQVHYRGQSKIERSTESDWLLEQRRLEEEVHRLEVHQIAMRAERKRLEEEREAYEMAGLQKIRQAVLAHEIFKPSENHEDLRFHNHHSNCYHLHTKTVPESMTEGVRKFNLTLNQPRINSEFENRTRYEHQSPRRSTDYFSSRRDTSSDIFVETAINVDPEVPATPRTSAKWEKLRQKSRLEMSRRMLQGWTMADSCCAGRQCHGMFLLSNHASKPFCCVCHGSGSGKDGQYAASALFVSQISAPLQVQPQAKNSAITSERLFSQQRTTGSASYTPGAVGSVDLVDSDLGLKKETPMIRNTLSRKMAEIGPNPMNSLVVTNTQNAQKQERQDFDSKFSSSGGERSEAEGSVQMLGGEENKVAFLRGESPLRPPRPFMKNLHQRTTFYEINKKLESNKVTLDHYSRAQTACDNDNSDNCSVLSDASSKGKSATSDALGLILEKIEKAKSQLQVPEFIDDASISKSEMASQMEIASLIEKLASAAVAVRKLEEL